MTYDCSGTETSALTCSQLFFVFVLFCLGRVVLGWAGRKTANRWYIACFITLTIGHTLQAHRPCLLNFTEKKNEVFSPDVNVCLQCLNKEWQ